MQVKKQHLEPDMEQWTGSTLGKKSIKVVYRHPAYLTYMQSASCANAGLVEGQAGIKIARRNINNLRYADDATLMAESEQELKSLLIKVKEDGEKVGLKLNIQKTVILSHHFMANRWGNKGNSERLYFLGLQNHWMAIVAMKLKGACSLEKSYDKPR